MTTIFKNYAVIDNAIDRPDDIVNRALSINYFSNEAKPFTNFNLSMQGKPEGIWRGYRSEPLDTIDSELFNIVNDQICRKIFGIQNYQYVISSYLHRGDKSIDCQDLWHKDTNVLFAYVLYLSPNPPESTGTLIKVDNEICSIENKFNRLVVYNSALEHRVEGFFGDTFDSSRLTLTGFIHRFCVSN